MIDEERVELTLGWRHTCGFPVHNEVVVQPGGPDEGPTAGAGALAAPLLLPEHAVSISEGDGVGMESPPSFQVLEW